VPCTFEYDARMTYCVGVLLDDGMVLASDSRTHAGVDNIATFCKMTVFERPGNRVIVLLSSGNLAGTQAVISTLKQRAQTAGDKDTSLWNAHTMFDVAMLVSDAVRDIESRDGPYLASGAAPFNASFIIGGQIQGEPLRLFRTFAEGNFIEAGQDTPYIQTGEAKFGKPIIDRVVTPATSIPDAIKCLLISFDSTMRSNLSVGMPIDLLCIRRDECRVSARTRFAVGDAYFNRLSNEWRDGIRDVFARLPDVPSAFRTADRPHPPALEEYSRDR
jgi:putative proteasome-type protease